MKASQAPLTSRNNLRQATGRPHREVSKLWWRKISLAPMPGVALFSTGTKWTVDPLRWRRHCDGRGRWPRPPFLALSTPSTNCTTKLRPRRRNRGWRQPHASSIPLVRFRTPGPRGRKRNGRQRHALHWPLSGHRHYAHTCQCTRQHLGMENIARKTRSG